MRYAETQAKRVRDFEPRKRLPTIVQFTLIFLISYVTLIGYFTISTDPIGFSIWSFVLIAVLAAFITHIINYSRDLLFATEFQNAIFASALRINYLFSIIAREDGSIIFVDQGLQDYFADFSRIKHNHLNDFFELAAISEEHQEEIMNCLSSMQPERLLLSVRVADGKRKDLVLSIDPLSEPGKFSLLRARPYSDKRVENTIHGESVPGAGDGIASLAHKLPVGAFSADQSGKLLFVNHVLERWLGYTPGHFSDKQYSLDQLLENPAQAFNHGEYQGEILFRHHTGQLVPFRVATYVEEQNRVVTAMGGIVYPSDSDDVVKKKSNDHVVSGPSQSIQVVASETAPSTKSVADLFEEAPIAIVRCNNTGEIIHVNKAFDQLIKQEDTSRPKHLLDLIAEDKKDEVSEAVNQLLQSGSDTQHVDVEFLLANNDTVAVSIFANQSPQNDLITFYLIDVSEQKNLELRFAHSQKMQAVGQLAGGVAHDFNNLLTAMIGFCDLLLMRHPAGDQSFADIMQIKQNANRAANLVRQLLAFSRRQTLQAKNLDITEVLAELSNLIRRLIGENIELKMIHGRDLHMIKADQGQLEQVIINLAVNARDAMADGGVLTVRSSNTTIDSSHPVPRQMTAPAGEDGSVPAGDYVLIEVSDTGIGIPKNVMAKIFEPFFSTKEIGSGTGLGLATVYGIIKQTGGYVFVNSVERQGTQFQIYFPALSAAEERVAEAEIQEQNEQDLTGRETILLVEDETPVRAFASRALKNKGYTVIEADSGETALELIRDHGSKLDLIVTDVIMPGINGPSMVEKISIEFPDIKVIFISGYAEDVFMHNYGSERSFNFLAKPFTLKQLAAKVKEVLSS